ncbi:MAG: ATP synthase F1 subunit gamma [Candidatus Gracilibacteria bacterium]
MSLLEVKKQIEGVKSTKKITKAMQLVAASKMRNFQRKALSTRSYVLSLLHMLEENMQNSASTIFSEIREEGKSVFVLYTSDKGLCGGLNTQLEKALFQSNKWNELPPEQRILITIGKKATEYARSIGVSVQKSFVGLSEDLTTLDALGIVDELLNLWNSEETKEILFVVPHYHNSFTFYPRLKTFLPFSEEMISSFKKDMISKQKPEIILDRDVLYEPSKESVLDTLYEQLIQSAFIQSFFELKASEYSSRMVAMQSATEAAEKKVGELTLVYNKTRQQAITQQIAEIVAAGEAIAS